MSHELEVEIFRAGDYGAKGRWGEPELERLAADYDPTIHEAPVTLDHAQAGPALGWVAGLRHHRGRLSARLRDLNARLLDLLREGSYKKRSVELYPVFGPAGRPYLRAVSFLGAAAPEIKGMDDALPAGASFAESAADGPTILRFVERRDDAAEPAAPAPAVANAPVVDFAELHDRLRREGRWLPAWETRGIAGFFDALNALPGHETADDARHEAPRHPAVWFAEFLAALSPVVSLAEAAPAGAGDDADRFVEDFAPGAPVCPDSLRLHRAALRFQESHPGVGYGHALLRCAR